MKKISIAGITGIILLFISLFSQAQSFKQVSVTEPYPLSITYNKTTSIVFPFAIQSVDRGSMDVLAEKAKGVDNILLVKAGRKGFGQTNLTVITNDGKLYHYYADSPKVLSIRFFKSFSTNVSENVEATANTEELKIISEQVAKENEELCGLHSKSYGVKLTLQGIYIYNDVFYCQFILKNKTAIAYAVDQLRFFIRDQKKIKRTAAQEVEITPLYTSGNATEISGNSEQVVVFALPKFTIPDQKYLEVQMLEKNGGRNLTLKVKNRHLVQAKPL
jgi:conjugative transposon TraN protein